MLSVVAFGLTLLAAVLLSALAHRSVLSTAVLFLAAGFLFGPGGLNWVPLQALDPRISRLVEIAMFAVLFVDGMEVEPEDFKVDWALPVRALALALPLSFLAIAVLGRLVAGLSWAEALLLGAALSPTDPILASAIVGREETPRRLRKLLNLESGLNDGLALPLVIVMLGVAGPGQADLGRLLQEVGLGIFIGIAVSWGVIRLKRSRFFAASGVYEPLGAVAIGLLVLSVSSLLHANEFLAAFTAGITIAASDRELRESFRRLGEEIAELLKLAALMAFGALVGPQLLTQSRLSDYLLALLVLLLARPVALWISFLGSPLDRRELLAAGWFGPRGFASVFFGLLILKSGVPRAGYITHLMALVITLSILLHSSTDVLVARWLQHEEGDG